MKELRAEWCWVSGVEGWRGCGRDRAPGAGKSRRAWQGKCPIAVAPSSAGRALPNLCLEVEMSGVTASHVAAGLNRKGAFLFTQRSSRSHSHSKTRIQRCFHFSFFHSFIYSFFSFLFFTDKHCLPSST